MADLLPLKNLNSSFRPFFPPRNSNKSQPPSSITINTQIQIKHLLLLLLPSKKSSKSIHMGACFSNQRKKGSREKKVRREREATRSDHGVRAEAEPAGRSKEEVVVPISSGGSATATTAISNNEDGGGKDVRKNEGASAAAVVEDEKTCLMPMRASSCTKEEVDAILIQCGRLSRSSSGKTPNEVSGGGVSRRYSGTKRSFDFDDQKGSREEGDWERSRPSPRRRTPGRERSASRERKASRSPARRVLDSSVSSGSQADNKLKQPAKMVSVPPREKAVSGNGGDVVVRMPVTEVVVALPPSRKGNPSPRSQSPANPTRVVMADVHGHHQASQSIGRNNSPHRRIPMTEIDENCLRRERSSSKAKVIQKNRECEDGGTRAPSFAHPQVHSRINEASTVHKRITGVAVAEEEEAPEQEIDGAPMPAVNELGQTLTRNRSLRRASKDLDQNPISYSALLNDFQQSSNGVFSLPSCVAKACSILEAVADLNSFNNEREDRDHPEFRNKSSFLKEQTFVESELFSKDDLMEPSLHRYVTTRSATADAIEAVEPQESAGSNSFVGNCNSWPASSSWEPTSADSTDRYWTSTSITGEGGEPDERDRTLPEKSSSLVSDRGRRAAGSVSRAGGLGCESKKKRASPSPSPSKRSQIRSVSGAAASGVGVVVASGVRMEKGSARVLSTLPVLAASSS